MRMRMRAQRVAALGSAVLLAVLLVACSPQTPPASEVSDEVSVGRLCEAMQLTDTMARDVLSVLETLGYCGEVLFAYPATDDDGNGYYHVWIGEETVDVTVSPRGTVTAVRRGGVLQYDGSGVPDAERPSEPAPLRLVSMTEEVGQGESARVELTAEAGVEYGIEVLYKSGPSTAKGLEPRLAAPNGSLVWTWTVSSRVLLGEYRIRVFRADGEGDALELTFSVVTAP